jgi:hypothetical protein
MTMLLIGEPSFSSPSRRPSHQGRIIKLSPRQFANLPAPIIRALEARRCLIPQADFKANEKINVISGSFRTAGQKDWAVMCSRNGISSILVFWNGSPASVAEVARMNETGCWRALEVVGRQYILEHYEIYKESGAPKPPPIDHDGIDDAFCEKASTVRYWYRGKWLDLQGAD